MDIDKLQNEVEFKGSFTAWEKMGFTNNPEYGFIGRSNVGKSSLINMLLGRKNLAHISSQPGKTQTMNLYIIGGWNIVDLPGFGYAKISKGQREKWLQMIEDYFLNRKNLLNLFFLVDASIPPRDIDLELATWLGEHQIPFAITFTKTDKGKGMAVENNIEQFLAEMKETWAELPPVFKTSAQTKIGREDILDYINKINKEVGKKMK